MSSSRSSKRSGGTRSDTNNNTNDAGVAATIATTTSSKRAKLNNTTVVEATSATTITNNSSTSEQAQPTDPEHFDHFLFQLLLFKATHNTYHVSKDSNHKLYQWLQHIKREYSNYVHQHSSALTRDQVTVLEHLHVPLTSRGDDHWNRFFDFLVQYKQRHGHAMVPRLCEIPGLGDWVTDQRRQYKAWKQGQSTQLNQERREKMQAIGFVWQVRNRPEWEERYQELVEYKAEHGDCKVPQHYKENKPLGKWVAKQREQWKLLQKGEHSFLTPYRLEKLEELGFTWQVRLMTSSAAATAEGGGGTPAGGSHKKEDVVDAKVVDEEQGVEL